MNFNMTSMPFVVVTASRVAGFFCRGEKLALVYLVSLVCSSLQKASYPKARSNISLPSLHTLRHDIGTQGQTVSCVVKMVEDG